MFDLKCHFPLGFGKRGGSIKCQRSSCTVSSDCWIPPYFARIDFRGQDEAETMKVYIGKFAFWNVRSPYEVYDWRAPIASMYYEFEDGDAWYDEPDGKV